MEEWSIDVLPGEVLRWAQEDAAQKHPRLWVRAGREYSLQEGPFDRVTADDDVNLVEAIGVLEMSPMGKKDGWTLLVRAKGTAELRPAGEGAARRAASCRRHAGIRRPAPRSRARSPR